MLKNLFFFVGAVALLLLAQSANAQTTEDVEFSKADLSVQLLHSWPNQTFDPLAGTRAHVTAHNRGSKEQVLNISLEGLLDSKETLLIPPGETRRLFIASPASENYYSSVSLSVKGTSEERQFYPRSSTVDRHGVARLGNLPFPLNVDAPWINVGAVDDYIELDPRALGGLRAIVVDGNSLTSTWKHRSTIGKWLIQGGTLLVGADEELLRAPPNLFSETPFAGRVETIGLSAAPFRQEVGMGQVVFVPQDEFASMNETFETRTGWCFECDWGGSSTVFAGNNVYENGSDQIYDGWVDELQLGAHPVLFLVLLVFAFFAGPYGWRVFVVKRSQPFVYLAVAGAASILFSAGIVAADGVAHGFSTKTTSSSVVLLDGRREMELRLEEALAWAPTSFSEPIAAPAGADLMIDRSFERYGGSPSMGFKEVSGDLQKVHNTLIVREPALVSMRQATKLTRRLEVKQQGDGLLVENQLGRPLNDLVIWWEGKRYETKNLAPGQRDTLTATKNQAAAMPALGGKIVPAGTALLRSIVTGGLGQNRFVASSPTAPNAPTLLGESAKDSGLGKHVIGGLL